MEGTVIEIIEQYLEWELVKHQRGYSSALRLQYDNDAKYYLEKGYSEEEALHADTVISFGQYIKLFWRSKLVGLLIEQLKALVVY